MTRLTWYGSSFKGRRETNQDGILAVALEGSEPTFFFAVADGMGGAAGGEVASRIVLGSCVNYLATYFTNCGGPHVLKGVLASAIDAADEAVSAAIQGDTSLSGMGSTLVCMLVVSDRYVIGNIGDSRAYRIEGSPVRQLTRDHSFVQESATYTGDGLRASAGGSWSHVITRALTGAGHSPDLLPESAEFFELEEGAAFLLCSDGLIASDEGGHFLFPDGFSLAASALRQSVDCLMVEAYRAGSQDNVSALCVLVGDVASPRFSSRSPVRSRLARLLRLLRPRT